ncbi:hypothetical protein JTB14_019359 [Gonioctena quinquepunctata]|nr:hypothetical protein JTB14_019359 [Gonioctena quinquepunctata]
MLFPPWDSAASSVWISGTSGVSLPSAAVPEYCSTFAPSTPWPRGEGVTCAIFLGLNNQLMIPQTVLPEIVADTLETYILNDAKKLKGTGILILLCFIPEDYEKTKYLLAQQKLSRSQNEIGILEGNNLVINEIHLTYQ